MDIHAGQVYKIRGFNGDYSIVSVIKANKDFVTYKFKDGKMGSTSRMEFLRIIVT